MNGGQIKWQKENHAAKAEYAQAASAAYAFAQKI